MGIEHVPPGWVLILGAPLLALLRGRARQLALLLLPAAGLAQLMFAIPDGVGGPAVSVFGYELSLLRVDPLARLWGTVFYIAAFMAALYSWHVEDGLQHVAAFVYAGAAISAVFAGDLITLFVYWELTAISSVFLIWASRTRRALRAGMRYLIIQVGSGMLLLVGIVLHVAQTGSVAFTTFGALDNPATWLLFVAIGIKAAFPLLHNWLQDAYPEATVTGTVWLSVFTTKLAIYALARGFPGEELLIPIGALMTAFPIFYAVLEDDLRRVLSYSLNNQLGFMVVGIGIGTTVSINGAAAHAFAHILYKSLLFMSMGAVLYRAGTCNASALGGLYKSMPWTTGLCIVGAVSISAFPLTSGFVSKSIILTAATDAGLVGTFLVLLFASAGVLHHSGIKIPYFAFFAHDSGIRVKEAPLHMRLAMGIAAVFCIGIGLFPGVLYAMLPSQPVTYEPYTVTHVVTQLQLLMWAALAFALLAWYKIDPPELRSTNLDTDWFYRKAAPAVVRQVTRAGGGLFAAGRAAALRSSGALIRSLRGHHEPSGLLGDPWPVGSTALAAVLLLALYLAALYL